MGDLVLLGESQMACSTASSRHSRREPKARAHYDRLDASEGASHGGQPSKKGAVPRRIGGTKGADLQAYAVCDDAGKPLVTMLSEGQMSDYIGARLILDALAVRLNPDHRQRL